MRKLAQGPWGVRRERTKSLVFRTSPLWRYQLSFRPICNADINELPGMASRHSDLDRSVRAALLVVSFVNADSPKMQPGPHIWLLGHERSSLPVQFAPASGAAAGIHASSIPELPAKIASDNSLTTGVIRPAVVTPPMHTRDVTHTRDVLVVNASHATMACLSPLGRDSRIEPRTCNTSKTSTGHDTSLRSKACMTSHSRYTPSSSHSSMESETHHAR